jgi:tetratricopeptide (TPR) repeat protein
MLKNGSAAISLFLLFALLWTGHFAFGQTDKGIELYEARKYQDAAQILRDTLNSEPDNLNARYYLGLSLLQLNRFGEALDELEKTRQDRENMAAEARPSSPAEAHLDIAIGRAYTGLKDYEKAQRNLDAAKEKDPENSDTYLYRGILSMDQKHYDDALSELQKAISIDPRKPYPHYYSGIAYGNSGHPDKMILELQTFLKLAPNAPEAPKVRSMLKSVR